METSSPSASHTPFLTDSERNDASSDNYQEKHSPRRDATTRYGSLRTSGIIFHSLMIFVYIVLTIAFIKIKPLPNMETVYSPLGSSLQYSAQLLHDSPDDIKSSKYVGSESPPELDEAWYHLLRHHNVRLTGEDLQEIGQTSVQLEIGGGYLGMLGVFHELHCLKLVRETLHLDHYAKTEKERKMLTGHAEHCIDALRQMAMCRGDTTIFPYHWNNFTRTPAPTWRQKHTCVNWDEVTRWLDSRVVDIHQPGMLIHPEFGASYPVE